MENYLEKESSENRVLKCANCGGDFISHNIVDIYMREEDCEKGIHSIISKENLKINGSMKYNPSSRRHGLKIYFECEFCESPSRLVIYQHKGKTYIKYEGSTLFEELWDEVL